jgi:hypothetical protein
LAGGWQSKVKLFEHSLELSGVSLSTEVPELVDCSCSRKRDSSAGSLDPFYIDFCLIKRPVGPPLYIPHCRPTPQHKAVVTTLLTYTVKDSRICVIAPVKAARPQRSLQPRKNRPNPILTSTTTNLPSLSPLPQSHAHPFAVTVQQLGHSQLIPHLIAHLHLLSPAVSPFGLPLTGSSWKPGDYLFTPPFHQAFSYTHLTSVQHPLPFLGNRGVCDRSPSHHPFFFSILFHRRLFSPCREETETQNATGAQQLRLVRMSTSFPRMASTEKSSLQTSVAIWETMLSYGQVNTRYVVVDGI